MKTLGTIQADANAEVYAVATGALPDGKPVIVNSNGTVSVVSLQSISTSAGTPVDLDAGSGGATTSCVFDPNSNKVVVFFQDKTNSSYGTAKVGTVSGNAISFGSKVVFNSDNATKLSATFDSNSNKVIVAFTDYSNSQRGTAIVGTVSGTSISFGSKAVFETGTTADSAAAFDSSNNKVVIAYADEGNSSKGKAAVGTVSGTSISFGSPVEYESGATNNIAITFDSNSNKIVIAFTDLNNSFYGKSVVGTVSGTGISFGSLVTFNSARSEYMSAAFDTTANKVVITYRDGGNSSYGTALVGTVSGTDISFGSSAVFYAGSTNYTATNFDSGTGNIVISYQDAGNSKRGTVITGTVSGTGIGSFGTAVVFETTALEYMSTTFDSTSNRVINTYADNGDGDKAKVVVIQAQGSVSNLTSENFLGFTGGEVVSDSASQALGSEATFTPSDINASYIASAFDSNTGKVATVYRAGNGYAYVVVGTVSGTNITFGTPVAMASESSSVFAITFDSNANKIVVFQRQDDNGSQARAYVGTISGTSVSFGSAVVAHGASTFYLRAIFDSNSNKVVFVYQDDGNSDYGTAVVGTVSGTSISFGTAVVFESASTLFIGASFDSTVNKVVIVYRDGGNSNYGTAIVGTVSGTDISFGSPAIYHTGGTASYNNCVYDSDQNKTVIVFGDGGDSNKGKACVGTISGTNISFGSVATFDAASSISHAYYSPVYDTEAKRIVVSYSTSANLELVVGTVSETSISFETAVVLDTSNSVTYVAATFDSTNNKVITSWRDPDADGAGKSIVLQTGYVNTTRGEIADGKTATIQVGGAINTKQLSLTAGQQYFVQGDGTIGTTAASPSVIAGTAVSATDLIVKG